mgnify:CR=1 FL=1
MGKYQEMWNKYISEHPDEVDHMLRDIKEYEEQDIPFYIYMPEIYKKYPEAVKLLELAGIESTCEKQFGTSDLDECRELIKKSYISIWR